MAIGTYTELQSAIGNWLDHSLYSARAPEFISLFEASANRRLRVRQQETTAVITVTAGSGNLPSDYLAWRQVISASAGVVADLEYDTSKYLTALFPTVPSGPPTHFYIQGTQITVRPVPTSETIAMIYFAKVAALTDSATTNWLLTEHPDLYLFGSLVEAEMFGVDDERAPLWKARRDEIFDEIEKLSNKSRGAGVTRVFGPTP